MTGVEVEVQTSVGGAMCKNNYVISATHFYKYLCSGSGRCTCVGDMRISTSDW